MRLKKQYKRELLDDGEPKLTDEGRPVLTLVDGKPVITHVDVLTFGDKWNPSTRIMELGQAEGWLVRDRDVLTINTGDEVTELKYRIVVPPGLYCCHCGMKMNDSLSAQQHIKDEHGDDESPSKSHPAGYARHNFYMTELIEE